MISYWTPGTLLRALIPSLTPHNPRGWFYWCLCFLGEEIKVLKSNYLQGHRRGVGGGSIYFLSVLSERMPFSLLSWSQVLPIKWERVAHKISPTTSKPPMNVISLASWGWADVPLGFHLQAKDVSSLPACDSHCPVPQEGEREHEWEGRRTKNTSL